MKRLLSARIVLVIVCVDDCSLEASAEACPSRKYTEYDRRLLGQYFCRQEGCSVDSQTQAVKYSCDSVEMRVFPPDEIRCTRRQCPLVDDYLI